MKSYLHSLGRIALYTMDTVATIMVIGGLVVFTVIVGKLLHTAWVLDRFAVLGAALVIFVAVCAVWLGIRIDHRGKPKRKFPPHW